MKNLIFMVTLGLLVTAFCAAQTQLPESGSYKQEGLASWYGQEFQGRPTASGELFDPNLFTAAHPDLPFGTILTVTNLLNSKQVQVRVNDRGPFVKSRIIDVSKAAAERLDMLASGVAQVRVEIAPWGVAESTSAPTTTQIAPAAPVNTAPAPVASPVPITPSQFNTVPVNPARNNAAAQAATTGRLPAPTQPSVQPQPRQPTRAVAPAQTPAAQQPQAQTATQMQPTQAYTTPQPAPVAPSQLQPVETVNRTPSAQDTVVMPSAARISSITPSATNVVDQTIVKSPPPFYNQALLLGSAPIAGKVYRIQVGSYKVARNAVEAFDRLVDAGFSPKWEQNDDWYRVVIPNTRAENLDELSKRLGNAGFEKVLLREER